MNLKPKLPKNVCRSVRVNSEVLAIIEKSGWTLQEVLDWAIEQKVLVETKIKLRR